MFHTKSLSVLSTLGLLALACSGAEDPSPAESPAPDSGMEVPNGDAFELTVSLPKLPLVQGTSGELTVEAKRSDGFDGAIALKLTGLPNGVQVAPATIEADEDEVTLVLHADDDAPHSLPTAVTIEGTSDDMEASSEVTVTVCGHPGALDTSFAGGRVIVPVGQSDDYANAIAVTEEGQLLVAGRSAEHLGDFAVIRLDKDGTLDESFGDGGVVTTDVSGGADTAYAVAIQDDGKIVLAGVGVGEDSTVDFAVVRYLPTGELDDDFGEGGRVLTPIGDDSDSAYALLVQRDGKLVVAGESNQGTSQTGLDFALVRYDTDGRLDSTFGQGGIVTTAINGSSARDVVYALDSQFFDDEERIVAVGGEGDFTLARYHDDGKLDTTFGTAGTLHGVLGSTIGAARAVRVLEDGKIVVAGNHMNDFALLRLSRTGELDARFGEGGSTITPISKDNWDAAQGMLVEEDGNIVLGGWVYEGNSSSGNFALARYTADGDLDSDFGNGGIVITEVAAKAKNDVAQAVLLQRDERVPTVRIVMAGSANGQNHDFAITRYWH